MKIKRLRKIIFHLPFNDNTLKIYDPYFEISIVPEKETFSGKHNKKIMFSIGRKYNDLKARKFFSSDSPLKQKIIERLSKETKLKPEEIVRAQKIGKLKDLLIEAVALQVKHLGIPVFILKKKARYEIFEYLKTSEIDEVLQLWYGLTLSIGRAIREFDPEKIEHYRFLMKKNLDNFLDRGYK
jgi:hypothetical protein